MVKKYLQTRPGQSVLITMGAGNKRCEVEQLAARRAHNPEVAGSSPALAIKTLKN